MNHFLRILGLVLLPLVVGVLTWVGLSTYDHWTAKPVLDYPATLDLGSRDPGELAVGRFTIANRGRDDLLLKDFRTSCSCAGVEREENGKFVRLESALIPPGAQLDLVVRVNVGGPDGEKLVVQVVFASNDPTHPFGKIDVVVPHVKGGVYAQPQFVVFGEVRVGGVARQVIDLFDNRHDGREIQSVRSLHPELFTVRLLPLDSREPVPVHQSAGRLMARLEVVGTTSRPGPLSGRIEIVLAHESRLPDVINVSGEVVGDLDCRPGTLILPRRSGDRALYTGQVLLRHRDGHAMRVEVENSPPDVVARVRPSPENADQCWLDVEWTGTPPAPLGEKVIRLHARWDDGETRLDFPVTMTGEAPPGSP